MRKFIAAACAALVISISPISQSASLAQDLPCVPLAVVGAKVEAAGATVDDLFASADLSFVSRYTRHFGGIPDDAEPVGIFIVSFQTVAFVAILENRNGYCVRYATNVPIEHHIRALNASARTA